jgi:hypothetical protein
VIILLRIRFCLSNLTLWDLVKSDSSCPALGIAKVTRTGCEAVIRSEMTDFEISWQLSRVIVGAIGYWLQMD